MAGTSKDGDEISPDDLPLRDAGITPSAGHTAPRRRRIPLCALLLVIPLMLVTGGIMGMYFQPSGLLAFLNVTGLKPGAGTDTPVAIGIDKVSTGSEVSMISEGDVLALCRLVPRGNVSVVSTPYGAGDARVDEVQMQVGDRLSRGDVIAGLDKAHNLHESLTARQKRHDGAGSARSPWPARWCPIPRSCLRASPRRRLTRTADDRLSRCSRRLAMSGAPPR